MHKKPLVAVIILGLLLLTPSLGFAAKDLPAGMLSDDAVTLLPRVARNLEKEGPWTLTSVSGTPTEMQAGVSRGGATICDGDGYGGTLGQYASFYWGDEFYAAYQDPENFGSCDGGSGLYTFDVTDVIWYIVSNTPEYHEFQPIVWENGADEICPEPGAVLCAGPLYAVDLSALPAGGYVLGFPFPTECCSYGPYFAGVYAAVFLGPGFIGIPVDNDGATTCWAYNDYGFGWDDMVADNGWVGDMFLWSAGVGYDQNACPGIPGVCDWQSWLNGPITSYWTDPNINFQTEYYVRFDATVSCTLETARFSFYCAGALGAPTVRVRVYGANGPIFGGLVYPDLAIEGANFLGFVDVPFGSLSCYPAYTVVDLTPLGLPAFGPSENFFITVSLSPTTPDPINDVMTILSTAGNGGGLGPNPHSGSYVGVLGDYYYFGEVFASGQRELNIDAFICCEVVELAEAPCASPGPDDWSTWAHDYQRTSASSMELGEPCEVTAAWYQPLNSLCEFSNPSIAGDLVYANSNNRLLSFDLETGVPGNVVLGTPNMLGANRGNTTIEGGFAYVTGGTARCIAQWVADLSVRN